MTKPMIKPMIKRIALLPALTLVLGGASAFGHGAHGEAEPQIPFEKYKLGNGLDVILHEDHRVPTVAVDVWYRVGSKDEVKGRTGFAHLFEHVMFQGSKHVPEDKHFEILQKVGVSGVNGSTSSDRTNYFEVVPSNQVEVALWLESDRMGFLLERAGFQQTLDNQRDVVKNERRQRTENAPMGGVTQVQLEALYPGDHPYFHEVIGSMADLSAAAVEDVQAFFRKWYAPNNATLVVAGDFDRPKMKELIDRFFGPIPAGPAITRGQPPPIPRLKAGKRIAMEAKIQRPQIYVTYHSPASYGPGDHELDVLASILAGGKSSRLYKRLVYEMKVAQSVSCSQDSQMLGGNFEFSASPMPGHDVDEILKVIDEEIERVKSEPCEQRELERVKNQYEASFFRRLEPLLGRAEQLHNYNYFVGDPGFIGEDLRQYRAVDVNGIMKWAKQTLDRDARVIVTVDPNPDAPIMGRVKK